MISIENRARTAYINEGRLQKVASAEESAPNRVFPGHTRAVKNLLIRGLVRLRLYPHILFTFMPFKIYEFKELLKHVRISGEDRILDLGCGSGLQTLILAKKCRWSTGIDVDPQSIADANHRAAFTKGKFNVSFYCTALENAGFATESFDKIFSFSVIEHVADYAETLAQAYRVLKTGGVMTFSVDSLESIQNQEVIERHRRVCKVENYFKMNQLRVLLSQVGFRDICIYPIFHSHFARKLFGKALDKEFRFGLLDSLLLYLLLRYFENASIGDRGIFLVIRCAK